MALRVSDVIGRDRLSALRAEGKDNAAILEEVNTVLDPIKKTIGEDVYNSFSAQGISFSKMKEYADYQAQKAVDAAKKAEEKVYQSEVKARKDEFMQPDVSYVDALEGSTKPVGEDPEFVKKTAKDGATFSDALVNNEARFASFINPANPFTGDKVDPYWAGVIQAMPELEKKYKEGRLTPEALAQYTQDQKNIENAKGVWDTLGEVGKDMYHRLQNPDAINVPAALGDMVSPENFIGGPAGGALAKVGTKVGAKLLSGAVAGAAADTAANYGYEYGVEKGQGASNEDARKGAAVQALAGALPGAVLGAGGAGLRMKRKLREGDTSVSPDADPNNPNQPKITFDMGTDAATPKDTFNPMSADEVLKQIDKVVIPKDVADSSLLKIEKGADDTVARAEKIAEISQTVTDPIEKAKAIAKEAPASAEEHLISYALNDGMPVSDRLAGYANVDALEKSILSNKQTPQEIYYTLSKEGFRGENLNKMVESYIKKDVNIYDEWAAAKLRESTKGETDARTNTGNEGQDTGVKTAGTDTVDARDGKTVDTNTKPQALPEPKSRDTENIGDTRRDTGNLDTKDGLPSKSEVVDGHGTVTEDVGTVPRDRANTVVQDENGVGVDEGVETPTQVYSRLKDEPAISGEEKARLRQLSEDYDVEQSSISDGVIKKYESGFELKSYPSRVEKIETILNSSEKRKISHVLSYVNDEDLIATLSFKKDIPLTRVINNYDVKHIIKKHGNKKTEASHGQIAVTKDDIANYPDIVGNADYQIVTKSKNGVYKVISGKQVNGHYVVVEEISNKKNNLTLKTMWKKKGELKSDTLRSIDSESLLVTSKTISGYEPDESMPSPRKASVNKSIANISKDVKKLSDLTSHRYFDDMVEMVKAEKAKEFHNYTQAELKQIEGGKITPPLASKLKKDLAEYAANPLFKEQRAEIDGGYRAFSDEAAILREMSHDEALNLVESETFRDAFDGSVKVDDVVKGVDDVLADTAKKVAERPDVKALKKELDSSIKELEDLKRSGDMKEATKLEASINNKKSIIDFNEAIKRMEDNC